MEIKSIILDLLFPPLCFGCRRYHKSYLCEHCWQKIQINTSFFCPVCQNRIPISTNIEISKYQSICHPDARFLLAPAADYRNEAVKNLIHELKFHRIASAMEPIKKILDEYLSIVIARKVAPQSGATDEAISTHNFFKNYSVVPIPISSKRLRQRGFNQAQLIAEHVARQCKWPIANGNLIKIKDNKKQSELKNWEERKSNVENCFSITRPELIKNENIILVDDVFTSGATINEAVKILKRAGARKIIALVIARAR